MAHLSDLMGALAALLNAAIASRRQDWQEEVYRAAMEAKQAREQR